MGNAASSAAPAGQAGDLRSSLANVTQERDMYKNEVFKQVSVGSKRAACAPYQAELMMIM
jgi:hypothetical protein